MAIKQEPLLHTGNKPSNFRMIILSIATIFALTLSVAFLAFNPTKNHNQDSSFSNVASRSNKNGVMLLHGLLQSHIVDIKNAVAVTKHIKNQINDQFEHGPLEDCLELMDLSIDRVTDSVFAVQSNFTGHHSLADAQAWLSAVLTNHETCFDAPSVRRKASMKKNMKVLISKAKASLAILAQIRAEQGEDDEKEAVNSPISKLNNLPFWVTMRDRNLLESSSKNIKADLVVAQDGTGNYTTLNEAVAAAPNKSLTRFVIHVKEGVYEEHVQVNNSNLMIVGDGMNLTIITGSLNVVDDIYMTTFHSATLAAVGDGFILQDICIKNTAGPEKHQAVALRVGADKSVINRCLIDAYQDTLYAHSLRQFYKDCYITGTVDFIFGNAAVVFQTSQLVARKPLTAQKNMVTAQGRTDPNQSTGTSIQNCIIKASDDLEPVQVQFPTYLGRPWKEFARVVYMESYMTDVIDPEGWSVWNGDYELNTYYFGEYMNAGPGSALGQRVNWTGYHIITDAAVAMNFTVAELIQGGAWLPSTGVSFTEGLTT